jgi:hypothetical protein
LHLSLAKHAESIRRNLPPSPAQAEAQLRAARSWAPACVGEAQWVVAATRQFLPPDRQDLAA